MIRFQCPQCGKKLKAADEIAGRDVKCSGCSSATTVPQPSTTKPKPKSETSEEPVGHIFGQSVPMPSSDTGVEREFRAKPKSSKPESSKANRRWTLGIAALLGLIVASAVTYAVIKQAYAAPKFKAEFESMAEVEFYRRAHGELEQTRRRMAVMANAFKAQGSPKGDFIQEHERLNASIDKYTSNSETLMRQAAELLAEGKDLHAKSMLVETGKEMKAIAREIEVEVGEFNRNASR